MKRTLIVAALLTAGLSAYGRSDPPPLAETLEFLHNAAASTVSANAPNSYSFDSHGCDVTIHDNGPIASTVHFSLRDVEPKWGLRGEHGMSVSGTLSPRVTTFSISTTQMRKKIRVDFDNGMDGIDSPDYQLFFVEGALAQRFAKAFSNAVEDCGGQNSPY